MKRPKVVILAVLALMPVHSMASAQTTAALSAKQGASGPVLEAALRERLGQLGMTTCTETFTYIAMYLANGQRAAFRAYAVGSSAARRPTYMTMESSDPGFPSRLSTLVVGPNCDGLYVQQIRWKESCREVKDKYFGKFKDEEILLTEVAVSTSGGVEVSLVPAGTGCLSVKTETFLR
jgi:hypothetical protein